MTIHVRDLMPTFTAINHADGTRVDYQDFWQRRNLVLVVLPEDDPTAASYAASLTHLGPTLAAQDTALIVTATPIPGIPSPGVVVADRWGEVYFVQDAARASELPAAGDLMEWVQYVRNECPECQGEAR